jgi:EmrB/QacA subfamily drug resistance transporter
MTLRWGTAPARWTIAATVLASALAAIDGTVVGIALPYIGRQFHSPLVSMQWVVNGYLLALGALLLVGGSLGDEFGRRRVFVVGIVWFTVASAACALAPDVTVLVITRILQGVGAALLMPGSLAILEASFAEEDRARAIGAWAGLGGVATAAGPLLGGYLITAASWRWIFLINVPVAAAALAIALRHVPESRRADPPRLDRPGAVLTVVFLAGFTYGLVEGPARGWRSPAVLSMLVVGLAAGATLVVVESQRPDPMVPLEIFRSRQFTVTNVLTFMVYAALGGALFLLPIDLEVVDRYSALDAGFSLLPVTILMLLFSARSGRLAARIGPRLQMSLGPVVVGAGLALLARTTHDSSYLLGVLPGILVFALGLIITVAPLTTTALSSAPDEHAGLASAFNNDVARVGGLIAVSVLPAVAGLSGRAYLHPQAMAGGFRTAVYLSGLWCVAGGLLAAAGIRNRPSAVPDPKPTAFAAFSCPLDGPPRRP